MNLLLTYKDPVAVDMMKAVKRRGSPTPAATFSTPPKVVAIYGVGIRRRGPLPGSKRTEAIQ